MSEWVEKVDGRGRKYWDNGVTRTYIIPKTEVDSWLEEQVMKLRDKKEKEETE
ncbi:hypothetical protein P4K49_30830 [Bacillus cereus]|uniref:hypothetical protein n=1 Tax=Bacillus cereus group TaxID=86661 RepID=UPI000B0B77FF|nr:MULTISPECIES: hypothetical protein [Bacillus cereus group]MCU5278238.1 hypothetical protein [Bacillus cereus]MEB9589421.1 hypothetical protein [Bacillus cereus]MEB9710339.1 hypothetical protein [Bacillus cereus]MEB9722488.1 hypothetical protein [Bacillus cereus]MEB9734250.1 hypothetical protein [Bacillus cereus]